MANPLFTGCGPLESLALPQAWISGLKAGWHGGVLASSVESLLSHVLIQLAVIIGAARLCALLCKRIGQPAAVGEIAAGLILGPSLLGWLAPQTFQALFVNEQASQITAILSQLGLVFLLFIIGLEFDFSHLKPSGPAAGLISLSGVALPFALGWGVAHFIHPMVAVSPFVPREIPIHGFALFMGTSMSITAIPILGRIMMELNITRTRLGSVTIAAAAFDDAVGWILLAACTAIVQAEFHVWQSLRMFLLTVGFGLLLIVALKPLLLRWADWTLARNDGALNYGGLATLIIVLFVCALATSKIGIFAIFGAFLLGAVFSGHRRFSRAVASKFGDFVMVFFLPIFFTHTGLHTDLRGLGTAQLWLLCGLICLTAIVGKFGGCMLAARFGGMNWRDSAVVGVMMNTRALMELIVLSVGYNLGVIPQTVFSMLVFMALLTTAMCTPLLLLLLRGDPEYRPLLAQSDFRRWLGAVQSSRAVKIPTPVNSTPDCVRS